jgi:hypothetical protein
MSYVSIAVAGLGYAYLFLTKKRAPAAPVGEKRDEKKAA